MNNPLAEFFALPPEEKRQIFRRLARTRTTTAVHLLLANFLHEEWKMNNQDFAPYLAIFKKKLLQKPLKWKNALKMPNVRQMGFSFCFRSEFKTGEYLPPEAWIKLRGLFPWLPKKEIETQLPTKSAASVRAAAHEMMKFEHAMAWNTLLSMPNPPMLTGAAGLIGRIPTPEEFDKLFRFGFAFRTYSTPRGAEDYCVLDVLISLEIKSDVAAEMMKMHSFIPLNIRKELAMEELLIKSHKEPT